MKPPLPDIEKPPACCRGGLFSSILPLALFGLLCLAWARVVQGDIFAVQWAWVPSLDLDLAFRLDGLGLLFSLIITMTGFFVSVYASSYMAGHRQLGRFFFYLHGFITCTCAYSPGCRQRNQRKIQNFVIILYACSSQPVDWNMLSHIRSSSNPFLVEQ